MAIVYTPFDELFAPVYQLTYISTDGHIDVGSNTYSVFHNYTMQERQVIFQVCEKYLPWEYTDEQEQWERTMYMYQFVIKSPPPFPYPEYKLSEDIIMAVTWDLKVIHQHIKSGRALVAGIRTEDGVSKTYKVSAPIKTQVEKNIIYDKIWAKYQVNLLGIDKVKALLGDFETEGKANLEARE